jgi:hypothetical protein
MRGIVVDKILRSLASCQPDVTNVELTPPRTVGGVKQAPRPPSVPREKPRTRLQ